MSGERLTPYRERVIRNWPRDRIKPRTVARCLDDVLAELDTLREELAVARATPSLDTPSASAEARAAAERLIERAESCVPEVAWINVSVPKPDILTVASYVLATAPGERDGLAAEKEQLQFCLDQARIVLDHFRTELPDPEHRRLAEGAMIASAPPGTLPGEREAP